MTTSPAGKKESLATLQRWLAGSLATARICDLRRGVATSQPGLLSHTHACGRPMTGTSDR